MRERDLLYILEQLSCYETTKEDILRFLNDSGFITMAGSDFENEIITDALEELNWTYICSIQEMAKKENVEEESEEEECEEEDNEVSSEKS